MARFHINPTAFDRKIVASVARNATPAEEAPAKLVTLLADERLLLGLGAAVWLGTRLARPKLRAQANHLAAGILVTAALPHLIKHFVDQQRPNRAMVRGRRHGIPKSGKASDAFPSGHAMHIGFIAAALTRFFPKRAVSIWSAGGLLAATRIVLLAHWTSDVLVGLASGVAIERLLWLGRPADRARPVRASKMRKTP
jgi:undecaprenyl-diphosphatase